jgi:hypothetical protein
MRPNFVQKINQPIWLEVSGQHGRNMGKNLLSSLAYLRVKRTCSGVTKPTKSQRRLWPPSPWWAQVRVRMQGWHFSRKNEKMSLIECFFCIFRSGKGGLLLPKK